MLDPRGRELWEGLRVGKHQWSEVRWQIPLVLELLIQL
jgi:hypothetical protein